MAQALGLVYREIHRVFESYLVHLFEEIALNDKRVLFSNQKISHEDALRPDNPAELQRFILEEKKADLRRVGFQGLEKAFIALGLPIVPIPESSERAEQEDVRLRLMLLSAIRNVMEHNRSIVNSEFLAVALGSPYKIGERIVISVTELGDALSAVEWAADDLNRRAVTKFGVGGAVPEPLTNASYNGASAGSKTADGLGLEPASHGVGVSQKVDAASDRLSKTIDRASAASETYAGKLVFATWVLAAATIVLAALTGLLVHVTWK